LPDTGTATRPVWHNFRLSKSVQHGWVATAAAKRLSFRRNPHTFVCGSEQSRYESNVLRQSGQVLDMQKVNRFENVLEVVPIDCLKNFVPNLFNSISHFVLLLVGANGIVLHCEIELPFREPGTTPVIIYSSHNP
jgi:hypothetical protein